MLGKLFRNTCLITHGIVTALVSIKVQGSVVLYYLCKLVKLIWTEKLCLSFHRHLAKLSWNVQLLEIVYTLWNIKELDWSNPKGL